MTAIDWQWYRFDDLTPSLLYRVVKLRQDVFILEQQCFYSDLDNQDQHALHLLGQRDEQVVAYLRIIPLQQEGTDWHAIGRVLTASSVRGEGVGRTMMVKALEYLAETAPEARVQLSAQLYLQDFYSSIGFVAISDPYDDDGIMHIDMVLKDND